MLSFAIRAFSLFLLCATVACSAAPAVTIPSPIVDQPLAKSKASETAVLAGGCFWGTQAVFEHVKGVTRVTAGYSGGTAGAAHYETVSSGITGHAESVSVVYDPSQVSYGQLLKVYFSVAHDPTELNRQGPDVGTQYRSAIFYGSDEQKRIAEAYIDQLNKAKVYSDPIVTQVAALKGFYPAEHYHQDYAVHHPDDLYIRINDLPKVDHLREKLPELFVSKQATFGRD
jgi:peptide-methionine (S)-S-oxide reductase